MSSASERDRKIRELYERLSPCVLCPRKCGVNRSAGEKGWCRTAMEISVASVNVHTGEEPPISGDRGSGTVFFSNCNLSCVFCQNYPISQMGNGIPYTVEALSDAMLELEKKHVHNINFVTPTHVSAQMADAVNRARKKGLKVPIVYNTGGYEDVGTLELLEDFVDIYLPDAKYGSDDNAKTYSGAPGYWQADRLAIKEMFRQKGLLETDENGIAVKGIIIRHMLLPEDIAGTRKVLDFIASEISKDAHISLMSQYHPAHKAAVFRELNRRITAAEYDAAAEYAEELGLENGWRQEL